MEKRRKLGRPILDKSPLKENKSSEYDSSHWLSCGVLLLAELVAGQGEILPSPCWRSKVGFFLFRMYGKFSACWSLHLMTRAKA